MKLCVTGIAILRRRKRGHEPRHDSVDEGFPLRIEQCSTQPFLFGVDELADGEIGLAAIAMRRARPAADEAKARTALLPSQDIQTAGKDGLAGHRQLAHEKVAEHRGSPDVQPPRGLSPIRASD